MISERSCNRLRVFLFGFFQGTSIRRLALCLPLLIACSDPVGPKSAVRESSSHLRRISFRQLTLGDTLIVDQHSVGCFMTSDAHLVFVGTEAGAVVGGRLQVGPRSAVVPTRYLTRPELSRLEDLLGLYRRDEHQSRCLSTGQHSTTFRMAGTNLQEKRDTDSCIEMEFVQEGRTFDVRPRSDILSLNEFTRSAYDEIFRRS